MRLAAKFLTKFLICTLVMTHVAPLPVVAGEGTDIFVLPEGCAGTYYQVKIQDVLRERYSLKLETERRAALFRWSFADGEIPPGLLMRPTGTLAGIPRAPRDEPYQFRVKVVDASVAGGGLLILTLSLKLDAPRGIRLSRIEAPRLVPLDKGVRAADAAPRAEITRASQALLTPGFFDAPESRPDARPSNGRTSDARAGMTPPAEQTFAGRFESVNTSTAPDASGGEATSNTVAQVATCDGAPQRPSGEVFVIDASDGSIKGKRDFKRNEKVSVVVANKNPYLYKYTFNYNTRFVEEPALGKFLPLLGGIITDLTAESDAVKEKAKDATERATTNTGGDPDPRCDETFEALRNALNADKNQAGTISTDVAKDIKALSEANKARKDKYDPLRKVLMNARSTDTLLYCNSKALLNVPEQGADPDKIDGSKKKVEALRVLARSFSVRADLLERAYPTCINSQEISSIKVAAEGFLALADKYDRSLGTIGDELKKMNDIKETVETVSSDPRNFMETHEFGPYRRTTEVTLGLQRTSLADANAKAQELVKADATILKFGEAPFFSISGGLVFSPLRKREFIRIQGFERDLQGNLVLVDGKPNLTTTIGQKEDSSSRIAPLVMLNGRLPNSRMGPIDGWHISLGITGKNDNKGTDIEYLVGPSVSMLEDNLFMTFGGYAGKQQKLGGNLFEGAAVPTGVDELPIEKNYRWNFGFALTYKLPIGK